MPDFHNNVDPGLGFIFPGQGSQALGMMDDLARDFDCVRSRFESALVCPGFRSVAACQRRSRGSA